MSALYYNESPAHAAHSPATSLEGRSLYVGNLDPKVTDGLLWEVFSTVGSVESCKVINDKTGESSGYGFVDFMFEEEAERALQALNGKKIYNKEIKVNWASHATIKEDTSNHHNVFVGDLSAEITDEMLHKAFGAFGSISDARVMWDQNTGRSRGYGFVSFRDRGDAERAISEMNGVWLGNRTIRCNWANQKATPGSGGPTGGSGGGSSGGPSGANSSSLTFEDVAAQAPTANTTVYVGNLGPEITEEALGTCFQGFGVIEEVRIQKDKGFGFVKFQNHDQATRAIFTVNGTILGSRPVRCSWGKERAHSNQSSHQQSYYGYYPYGPNMAQNYNYMYNMQPYSYGNYSEHSQYYNGQGYANYDPYAAYYQQQHQHQNQHQQHQQGPRQ